MRELTESRLVAEHDEARGKRERRTNAGQLSAQRGRDGGRKHGAKGSAGERRERRKRTERREGERREWRETERTERGDPEMGGGGGLGRTAQRRGLFVGHWQHVL